MIIHYDMISNQLVDYEIMNYIIRIKGNLLNNTQIIFENNY